MADIALVESWGWNGRPYIPYAKRKKARIQKQEQELKHGEEHEVEQLLASRLAGGKSRSHQYLVRWKDKSERFDCWEPQANVEPSLITAFDQHPIKACITVRKRSETWLVDRIVEVKGRSSKISYVGYRGHDDWVDNDLLRRRTSAVPPRDHEVVELSDEDTEGGAGAKRQKTIGGGSAAVATTSAAPTFLDKIKLIKEALCIDAMAPKDALAEANEQMGLATAGPLPQQAQALVDALGL